MATPGPPETHPGRSCLICFLCLFSFTRTVSGRLSMFAFLQDSLLWPRSGWLFRSLGQGLLCVLFPGLECRVPLTSAVLVTGGETLGPGWTRKERGGRSGELGSTSQAAAADVLDLWSSRAARPGSRGLCAPGQQGWGLVLAAWLARWPPTFIARPPPASSCSHWCLSTAWSFSESPRSCRGRRGEPVPGGLGRGWRLCSVSARSSETARSQVKVPRSPKCPGLWDLLLSSRATDF